jgi:hypothetical protein
MSGRKLGGGRILGNGKGLVPPAHPTHQRTSSLVPSSESTLSLSSRESAASPSTTPLATSPLPDAAQDLSSMVSLGDGGAGRVAEASAKLLCPICNEEMVSCLSFGVGESEGGRNICDWPLEDQQNVIGKCLGGKDALLGAIPHYSSKIIAA